jgi:hypothetical protein
MPSSTLGLSSRRHVRIPGVARFQRDVRKALSGRRIGDTDEVLTGWTLDLSTGELHFTFQRLITVGAIEFEFVGVHRLCPLKRNRAGESMLQFFSILFGSRIRLVS